MELNKRIMWIILGVCSALLIIANCGGLTPQVIGGLPTMLGVAGLATSVVKLLFDESLRRL